MEQKAIEFLKDILLVNPNQKLSGFKQSGFNVDKKFIKDYSELYFISRQISNRLQMIQNINQEFLKNYFNQKEIQPSNFLIHFFYYLFNSLIQKMTPRYPWKDRYTTLNNLLKLPFASLISKYDYYIHGYSIYTFQSETTIERSFSLPNEYLATANQNEGDIDIWDCKNKRRVYTLRGHTNAIQCMEYFDNKLITGSHDSTLRIWDLFTGQCDMILEGHTRMVLCILILLGKIISGSMDSTIKIWDIATGENETTFDCEDSVYTFAYKDNMLIAGLASGFIEIWNLLTYKKEHRLEGHESAIEKIRIYENYILSASEDTSLIIWENYKIKYILQDHTDTIFDFLIVDDQIITASHDSTIKIWNFQGKLKNTLHGHKDAIWGLEILPNNQIMTFSKDSIRIWDLNTHINQELMGDITDISSISVLSSGRIASTTKDGEIKISE